MTTEINQQKLIAQLCCLGFTQLESEVYLYLLVNGSNTGYAVAKGIKKAVANVYKAVEGLSEKGAVEVAVGDSKICHAVAWQQVLSSEQSRFDKNLSQLSEQLKQLPEQLEDEAVYQLQNANQVLTTASSIIKTAQTVLVAEIEPLIAELLVNDLEKAAARGVDVRIKIYEPLSIKGANITLRKKGSQVYQGTKDVSFKLCADGNNALTAALSHDLKSTIQAFKTKSALVCMDMYCGLIYELILTELKQAIPAGDIAACQKILNDTEHLHPFSTQNSVFSVYQKRYLKQNQ